jgi:hypothetical protein
MAISVTRKVTITFLAPSYEDVDFLVDATYLQEIPHDAKWREEANARINKLRRGKLTVK